MSQKPLPVSRFRDDVLERYPEGEKHELIKQRAQRWVKTSEWRFRRAMQQAAWGLIEDAEAIYESDEERDPWLTAECAVDLAESCRHYLRVFEEFDNMEGIL